MELSKLGIVGLAIPESYGGGSYQDLGVLYHEMGRACVPTPHFSSAVLSAKILVAAGTDAQKAGLLPSIAQGERILVPVVTEPDLGWNPDQVQLLATKQGDFYVLNGTKLFIPDAQVAHQLIVAARTGPDFGEDVTLFLVGANASGIAIRNLEGFIASRLDEITFDSVNVLVSAVVGSVGGGWDVLDQVISRCAPVLCSYMVGNCEQVFEITRDYAGARVQFGSPIGTFQRVQDHIIEIVNTMDAARWTTAEALRKLDAQKPDWKIASSLAKAVASEFCQTVTYHAHEVLAGAGSVREHPVHLYTRAARTLSWYLGDTKYHRKRLADLLEL